MSDSVLRANPLEALHRAAGAALFDWEGCAVPARFEGRDAEIAACREGAGLFDLAHVEPAEITGGDCRRWSNSMFTNNLRKLRPGQGNRNALADPKGRLLAVADVYLASADPDRYLVVPEGTPFSWLFERLDRYIIMDDVELTALEGVRLLSLQGPGADGVASAAGLPLPDEALAERDGIVVLRRDRTGLGGLDLLVPEARLEAIWAALREAGAVAAGMEALEALRVLAGKPRWPVDMGERSFVHELLMNEELLAFDKGCYLGQEVINRMDTMGRVNKRLAGITVEGSAAPGAELVFEGKPVGTITSAVDLGGRTYGLAVVRNPAIEAGEVQVAGARAAVTSPPFQGE